MGVFHAFGCVPHDPHKLEEVVDPSVPGAREDSDQFVGYTVRARCLVVG